MRVSKIGILPIDIPGILVYTINSWEHKAWGKAQVAHGEMKMNGIINWYVVLRMLVELTETGESYGEAWYVDTVRHYYAKLHPEEKRYVTNDSLGDAGKVYRFYLKEPSW